MENQHTPNPGNNLFEMSLSSEGANYITRVYKITRWLFILGIVISIIQFVDAGFKFRIYTSAQYSQGDSDWMSTLARMYPYFQILSVLLTLTQLYFFFNFSRIGNKSIELQQSDLFNESFKWLFRNTLVATTMFALQMFLVCMATYTEFRILANMH